ncbi:hypothetical protein ACFY36_47990 [Actinoplanes sp. NPDC000266]
MASAVFGAIPSAGRRIEIDATNSNVAGRLLREAYEATGGSS